MSNAISNYARLWHIDHPMDDLTVYLLGVAFRQIAAANINSHPKLDASGRKDLASKVKRFHELNKDLLANKVEEVEKSFKAFHDLDIEESGNIWANDEIFAKYYRAWKATMIRLGLSIQILPGWPPSNTDPGVVHDFMKDIREDLRKMMESDNEEDEEITDEDLHIPDMKFPENVSPELMAQVYSWVATCYIKYEGGEFDSVANTIISCTGLRFEVQTEPVVLIFKWLSNEKFKDAEKDFIEKNKRLSSEFETFVKSLSGEAPSWVKELMEFLGEQEESESESGDDVDPDGEKGGATASDSGTKVFQTVGVEVPLTRKFDPSMRMAINIPARHKEMLDIVPPMFMRILDDKLVIRNIPPTVDNIRLFCRENELDDTEMDDASFAGICVALAHSGAIASNTEGAHNQTFPATAGLKVSLTKIESWKRAARRMIDASFAFASQGSKDGELSWYESYSAVFGKVMKPRRFIQVCEAIMSSDFLSSYAQDTSIAAIRGANNVVGYRLIRLSSPVLVLEALMLVQDNTIYRMIDARALSQYVQFFNGGILAQVAAGPLKSYCRGNIDVLTTVDIPSDVKISELKAIDRPPYNMRLLRQAYIILEIYGRLPSRWYQGEKAMRGMDASDTAFTALVKAYKLSEKTAAEELVKKAGSINIDSFLREEKHAELVRDVMARTVGGL